MSLIVEFIKNFVVPGSAWFLILAASICSTLLYAGPRARGLGRTLLTVLLGSYWLMSLPIVALTLQQTHAPIPRAVDAIDKRPLPIVILGNGLGGWDALGATFAVPLGQTAMNTLFGISRYRQYPASVLIASGGAPPGAAAGSSEAVVIADALRRNGVPADHIVLEPTSTTTREQAVAIAKILTDRGDSRCILVTSAQQMIRAADVFQRAGVSVVPLPAGGVMWSPSDRSHWWWWLVPSSQARSVSRDVLYEAMAWPYYRFRGWIG